MAKKYQNSTIAHTVQTSTAGAESRPLVDAYWCENKAADYYGVSVRWMQRAREKGTGPRYCRLGGLVRYRQGWLDQFAERNISTSIADHRERSKPMRSSD